MLNNIIKKYTLLHIIVAAVIYSAGTLPAHAKPKHEHKYQHLNGKIIREVIIKLRDVFDHSDKGYFYDKANELKVNTKEYVIRREVLLKPGKKFNEDLMQQSERNLRTFRFLRMVSIRPIQVGEMVDLYVEVQDAWTIIPQVGFSSGTGNNKVSGGMVEHNLLGYGKKVGAQYEEENNRQSIEAIYEDIRFLGTQTNLSAGIFDRNDGEIGIFNVGRPFRSFEQKGSWSFNSYGGDTIGRLFQNGNENYIFRQENVDINARYAFSTGDPENEVHRLAFGYDYLSDTFTQADEQDYEDLNLNPATVSNDPADLATDRRFTGPSLTYRFIEPDYISRNYVDRFDRFVDYNLGTEYSINSLFAPVELGSDKDTYLFSASRSGGRRLGGDAFIRGEMGYASRFDQDGSANTLYRGEIKFYNVMGPQFLKQRYIGRHTLAFNLFVDYAEDLDKDRQFLVGGDNVIRGYKEKTFDGDKRLGVNLEDRVHLVDDLFQIVSLGAAVFVEGGGATYDSLGNIITDDFYSDVGAGLRIAFPRSTGSQVLRLDIAFPLRDGPDGSGQFEPRILISGGQLFNSQLRSEALGTEKANVDIGFDR